MTCAAYLHRWVRTDKGADQLATGFSATRVQVYKNGLSIMSLPRTDNPEHRSLVTATPITSPAGASRPSSDTPAIIVIAGKTNLRKHQNVKVRNHIY